MISFTFFSTSFSPSACRSCEDARCADFAAHYSVVHLYLEMEESDFFPVAWMANGKHRKHQVRPSRDLVVLELLELEVVPCVGSLTRHVWQDIRSALTRLSTVINVLVRVKEARKRFTRFTRFYYSISLSITSNMADAAASSDFTCCGCDQVSMGHTCDSGTLLCITVGRVWTKSENPRT